MSFFDRFKGNRPMYIIAGLGNPGSKYENTRHNIGWLALDELAKEQGVSVERMKFHALTGQCVLNGEKVLLMTPTTYMNNSGEAIEEARSFYKIATGNVIVISDDINLAPGKMRIRRKGGAGGHNGLKSIISAARAERAATTASSPSSSVWAQTTSRASASASAGRPTRTWTLRTTSSASSRSPSRKTSTGR